jgi:hypothetical protein
MMIFVFVLFFILTPGVLLTLPPKGSVPVVALVHALVFTVIFSLTNKMVLNAFYNDDE